MGNQHRKRDDSSLSSASRCSGRPYHVSPLLCGPSGSDTVVVWPFLLPPAKSARTGSISARDLARSPYGGPLTGSRGPSFLVGRPVARRLQALAGVVLATENPELLHAPRFVEVHLERRGFVRDRMQR